MTIRPVRAIAAGLGSAALVTAQTFDDLNMVRAPKLAWSQVLQVKAGMIGAVASPEDPTVGLENSFGVDGHVWYHSDSAGGQGGDLDVYAGRDGLFLGMKNGADPNETATRLELKGRIWPFYREGFYRGDNFVPVGRYEGTDYEAYLGFGREATQGLFIEMGPFYRRLGFDRNEDTDPTYTIPGDYNAYGGRLFLEQNTVQYERRSGLATDGFVGTLLGEREWNDSKGTFGSTQGGGFTTELPSAVWRARARLEWYIAQSDETCWEIFATGSFTDETDRVYNYDAQRPQGNLWGDAEIRFRFALSDSMTVAPYVHLQYVRILEENGINDDAKFFLGGGAEAWVHFSDTISLNAWYSYLDNESRPPVSVSEDLHGQHMLFAGMVFRFGASRR